MKIVLYYKQLIQHEIKLRKNMSKQLQVLCACLLAGIFIVQLVALFTYSHARPVVVRPLQSRAMAPDDSTEYGDCWLGNCTSGAPAFPTSDGEGVLCLSNGDSGEPVHCN